MKKILGAMRRAIQRFSMINEGDKIAVGISGGKDSMLLFDALYRYSQFSPVKFSLIAIHINMGFKDADQDALQDIRNYFAERNVPFFEEKTQLAELLFEVRQESNPCSLCSKMRRGALCSVAVREGANKLALGHHADDVLETFLLSFMYEGRLSTFAPTAYLSNSNITVIRPFILLDECDISGAARRYNLPVFKNPCPADKNTKRQYMKDLVKSLRKDIPDVRTSMTSAIFNPDRNNLW